MEAHGFTLFDTPLGRCGIAWRHQGIVGIQLPEGGEPATRARLRARFPGAKDSPPPLVVQSVMGAIAALLEGQSADLSSVPLDMTGVPPFHQRVYAQARTISPGATLSYGELAAQLGRPGSARAVGQALGRNPFAIVVPCHRVLASTGKVGGFSANGGIVTKIRLLALEAGSGADVGLGFDAALAVEQLRAADPELARLIDTVGPFRMRRDRTPSVFAALAEAIVYQQLTGRAAATIFARLRATVAGSHLGPTPEQILRASDAKLRSAGLSRSKALSLRDLARRTVDGSLPTLAELEGLDDEAIIGRLTQVRGVGRWTVEMLLIFRLGRPDVLPVDDYGIRKGFALAFRKRALPSPAQVERRGFRWKPYRTVASWYLWRAIELANRERRRQ